MLLFAEVLGTDCCWSGVIRNSLLVLGRGSLLSFVMESSSLPRSSSLAAAAAAATVGTIVGCTALLSVVTWMEGATGGGLIRVAKSVTGTEGTVPWLVLGVASTGAVTGGK